MATPPLAGGGATPGVQEASQVGMVGSGIMRSPFSEAVADERFFVSVGVTAVADSGRPVEELGWREVVPAIAKVLVGGVDRGILGKLRRVA